ncbi:MAG: hypothetical protein JNG90_18460 [Planctomycetaceae bacterium]|nr:hypothetical protein [Planctomycetaceae bacterium]
MATSNSNHDRASFVGALDRHLEILRRIHESLPASSQDREAIALATKALLFSMPQVGFYNFLQSSELTNEQRAHLDRLGIKPDEGD